MAIEQKKVTEIQDPWATILANLPAGQDAMVTDTGSGDVVNELTIGSMITKYGDKFQIPAIQFTYDKLTTAKIYQSVKFADVTTGDTGADFSTLDDTGLQVDRVGLDESAKYESDNILIAKNSNNETFQAQPEFITITDATGVNSNIIDTRLSNMAITFTSNATSLEVRKSGTTGGMEVTNDPSHDQNQTIVNRLILEDRLDPIEAELYPYTDVLDPTGFVSSEINVSYNPVSRTVTLTDNGANLVKALYQGKVVTELTNGWTSDPHPAGNGSWFLLYNGASFVWSITPWEFYDIQITYVSVSATATLCIKETHSLMQWQTHQEFHNTVGTYKQSGGVISNYTTGSTVLADRRPDIGATTVADEDNVTALPADTSSLYTHYYLSGSAVSNVVTDNADIITTGVNGRPNYNSESGGTWSQTQMANNQYAKGLIIAIPVTSDAECQKRRFMFIEPQQASTSLSVIQSLSPADFELGGLTSLTPEFVAIAEFIVQASTSDWTITEINLLVGTRLAFGSVSGGNIPSLQQVTEVGGVTNQEVILDLTGKGSGDRILSGYDSSIDLYYWSFRGDGTALISTATIGSMTEGTDKIAKQLWSAGKTYCGLDTDQDAILNITSPGFAAGFNFITAPNSSATEGLYTLAGTGGDYSDNYYTYSTYFIYSGNVSGNKYWFVDTAIRTGADAITLALFRTVAPAATPDVQPYVGIEGSAEDGNGGSLTEFSGTEIGLSVDTMEVRTTIDVPTALSSTEALNWATADGRYYNISGDTLTGNMNGGGFSLSNILNLYTTDDSGFGTSSPSSRLHVADSENETVTIENTSTAATSNKFPSLRFIGRDTVNGVKDAGRVITIGNDANYTNTSMYLYTSLSGTLKLNMAILSNGVAALPEATNSNISSQGSDAVLIKEWVNASVPATATSTGVAGTFAYDSSYFYVCTATNTWKRVAIATW